MGLKEEISNKTKEFGTKVYRFLRNAFAIFGVIMAVTLFFTFRSAFDYEQEPEGTPEAETTPEQANIPEIETTPEQEDSLEREEEVKKKTVRDHTQNLSKKAREIELGVPQPVYQGHHAPCLRIQAGMEISRHDNDTLGNCMLWQQEKNAGQIPDKAGIKKFQTDLYDKCIASGAAETNCRKASEGAYDCWQEQKKPWSLCRNAAETPIALELEWADDTISQLKKKVIEAGGTCDTPEDYRDDGELWFYLTCDGVRWKWDGNAGNIITPAIRVQ